MTTIKDYAETRNVQPYEVAAFLNLGRDWNVDTELTGEEIGLLDSYEPSSAEDED